MNSFNLSDFNLNKRISCRSEDLKQPNFDSLFDSETLCYDIFNGNKGVIIICPPLESATITTVINNLIINNRPANTLNYNVYSSGLVVKILFRGVFGKEISLFGKSCTLSDRIFDQIKNPRVLYTLQKDNNIEWILHYINWYVDTQKIDYAIIYDNMSSKYNISILSEALNYARCPVYVRPFNFKYGPGAYKGSAWDAHFCQSAAFEHVRYILPDETTLFNFDVDELLVSNIQYLDSYDSISFSGRWAFLEEGHESSIAHKNHSIIEKEKTCPQKWIIQTNKIPDTAFLQAHNINGRSIDFKSIKDFYIHFRSISTNWKNNRSKGVVFNEELHEKLILDNVGTIRVGFPDALLNI